MARRPWRVAAGMTAILLMAVQAAMPVGRARADQRGAPGKNQLVQNIRLCINEMAPPGERIGACTTAINSGAVVVKIALAAIYYARGYAYMQMHKPGFHRAFRDFTQAIRLNPHFAWAYLRRGDADGAIGRYTLEFHDYDIAIRLNPKFIAAYIQRGSAYTAIGRIRGAINDFDRAITLSPKFDLTYVFRGEAFHENGQNSRAIQDYTRAIRLSPSFALAYADRGAAYASLHEYRRSIRDLNQAVTLDPTLAKNFIMRGAVCRDEDHDRGAAAALDPAIALNPKLAKTYDLCGNTYFDEGHYRRAVAEIGRAIRLAPNIAADYFDRAGAYVEEDRYRHAIQDYDRTIRLDPKMAKAYRSRGVSYYYEGQFGRANADLRRAIDVSHHSDAYAVLWRFLTLRRLRRDGAAALAGDAAALKDKNWPYTVIEFYLGRLSAAQMRQAASNVGQQCEAAFYEGEWNLLKSKKTKAESEFRTAAAMCPKGFLEYGAAQAELKRLR